jgi:hypothetical protein
MSLRRLGAAVQEFGFSDGAPRLAEQDRALDSEAITSLAAEESHKTGLSLIALDPVRVNGFDDDR